MKDVIAAIIAKHKDYGIEVNAPTTSVAIANFEQEIGFALPADFVAFYSICNGFGCTDEIFNMLSFASITEDPSNFGPNWFYFAEYMIYCDMWGLRLNANGTYEIFNGSYPDLALTSSLEEFLNYYLKGGVCSDGGLYDWYEVLRLRTNQ